MSNKKIITQAGFTLIEVMVALLIVASVLGSTFSAITSFATQQQRIKERFSGQSIAWNQLMARYQVNNGWQSELVEDLDDNGIVSANGTNWFWQLNQEASLGRGVFKQTVNVYRSNALNDSQLIPSASLVLFEIRSIELATLQGAE